MAVIAPSIVAGGDITAAAFLKWTGTTSNNTVSTASTGEQTMGVADESFEVAPTDGAATYHSTAGHPVKAFIEGEECLLLIGSGGCNAGDKLKSDSSGYGVVASADHEWFGAIAQEAASQNEKARVIVAGGYISA